jgi:hypothetical protein
VQRFHRSRTILSLAFGAVLLLPRLELAAQESRLQIGITPRVGWFFPQGEIASRGEIEDPAQTTLVSQRVSYGISIDARPSNSGYGIRLNGEYIPDVDIEYRGDPTGGSVTMYIATAGVLIPTYGERMTKIFNLNISAGLGLKRYVFTEGPADVPQVTGTKHSITGQLSIGFFVPIGPIALSFGGNSYPSWFDPENSELNVGGQLQIDIFMQAGIRIPITR